LSITGREKRALILLALAVPMVGIYVATSKDSSAPVVVAPTTESIPAAEQRLNRMRQSVARVPGKEEVLKTAAFDLSQREKGLLDAETAPQAIDQLSTIIRKIARAQAPPVEIRNMELGQPQAYGDAYGIVTVAITTECRIEQLVNMMADISARPELVATNDMRISAGNPKEKTVNVRLSIAGLVPRKLVPQRRDTF
jgi:hypothetical protein